MDDRTRGRDPPGPAARVTRWVLLTGNRLVVAAAMLLGIGVAFLVAGFLDIATVTTAERVMWYLNGTVNGLLTLVPITVGVNQIVLSHEFGSIQDLYDRRTDITEFRERVEDHTGATVTSTRPSAFFGTLLSAIGDSGRAVLEDTDQSRIRADEQDDVETVVESVLDEVARVNQTLSAASPNMRRTFILLLAYDNTQQFHDVRRLATTISDRDPETADRLREIVELFVEIDAGRQFLKTVVVERELAQLSRLLVYTGIPAVAVAAIGIFSYRDIAGLTLPHPLLVGVAATLVVATLVPLAILGAYVLRVATIARQTAASGPFVP